MHRVESQSYNVYDKHIDRVVTTVIVTFIGTGGVLAIIGVGAGHAWSDTDSGGIWNHMKDYKRNEFQTTRAFSIFGTICAWIAFILGMIRLKSEQANRSKNCRLAFACSVMSSFLCILIAVAVWGDFAAHGISKSSHRPKLNRGHPDKLHLGWAFWVSVCATIFLFLANLLYLMRKDFQREDPVNRNTDILMEKDRFPGV